MNDATEATPDGRNFAMVVSTRKSMRAAVREMAEEVKSIPYRTGENL